MKRMTSCIMIMILCFSLAGCSETDVTDQVANVIQSEDENVLGVKGGVPNAYPGKTYGEAFENFFASPTWKYFVGTKEGTDDNGDGKPDYTEDNIDIVEFTGYCTYQDVEVKALIQFTLNNEEGTFEATYLSFNEVPQSYLMLMALMEAVFTNGDIENAGDEIENTAVQDSGQSVAEYVGQWWDTYSERCYMSIDSFGGETYSIDINWANGASNNIHWSFTGTYDSNSNGIVYQGSKIEEYYPDEGDIQETYVYTDGEGLLFIGDDGKLHWEDWTENAGEYCSFEKN